jgi:hypothetical protein
MATLQAARARELGLPEASAYSWGLNRAIFYAAAKRGFRGGTGTRTGKPSEGEVTRKAHEDEFFLGNEKAFFDKEASKENLPYFSIGDSVQTPKDFEKQIVSRFGSRANFEKAWDEALKIVRGYDRDTLESQQEFYEKVYKPRRDSLSKEWTERFTSKKRIADIAN